MHIEAACTDGSVSKQAATQYSIKPKYLTELFFALYTNILTLVLVSVKFSIWNVLIRFVFLGSGGPMVAWSRVSSRCTIECYYSKCVNCELDRLS